MDFNSNEILGINNGIARTRKIVMGKYALVMGIRWIDCITADLRLGMHLRPNVSCHTLWPPLACVGDVDVRSHAKRWGVCTVL